ncbi:transmembrane protein, putative (macronuclear) [Tetrahymena thermophila SB210]|uniref:Transmembrane protein, putative n=1 Tax=Tetrahymena thermophila (strain SB210) TaxID=312017 RepID=W7XJM8_TETTS|nr:transmembrane protein, putative [Tetrahymena thermophila SB210]EWS75676.1 transmembrane protein, putative [Tetrahymena thermophila SB210]|eukprot:XP_012651822.1 transmembrane protein, putative [Tetrahymena thermophila SB210]
MSSQDLDNEDEIQYVKQSVIMGEFLKIIDLEQSTINELTFFEDILACRTQTQITIIERNTLNIRGSIQSQGSAVIQQMYFLEEFYHLVISTDNVQYGQVFSYDLKSLALYSIYTNSYLLNQKSQVVQISFDKEQSFLLSLDLTGNFQCVYYQQQVQLLNMLKIIELTPQSKAQGKGFSLDFRTNNLFIYTQYTVYQVSYGDLGNRLIRIKTRNSNIYTQLQGQNQSLLLNGAILIAGEQGILYKYVNNQLKYFYHFKENITQIYYSSKKNYLLVGLTTSIAYFKKISYQSIFNQSGWNLNYTQQYLDNNTFVKFYNENLLLTIDNQIWHFDFENQKVIFKFKLKNLNDRITFDLYSSSQNILYLAISNGDFIIYDATAILIETINFQAKFQQSKNIFSPIVQIVETQSSIWVSYLTQYGVYQLSKSSKDIKMILDFSQIQTFQFQQDVNVDIFGVDDTYQRFFLNFATEQIVRVYNYKQDILQMDYLILSKKQHSQLLITANMIIFYSSSTIIIRDRSSLAYLQTIRRANIYNFIKHLIVLEDTYFLITYESKYELISLNSDYSLQYIDQQQMADPLLMNYQIIQDQYSSTNKILQVILLSLDKVQEFQYNLSYEVSQDQNKQCGVSMNVTSYLDMLQKIQNVKPFISFDPTFQSASVSNIVKQRNQYMVILQDSNLNTISYQGTQDNSLVISSDINISNSNFINNISEDGGSLQLISCQSLINIQNTTFVKNQALASGGAIYIEEFYGDIYFDKKVEITSNKALIGGGMRLKNQFYNNEDQFWLKYRLQFHQNCASLYGNNFATYLTEIKIQNNSQQSQFDTDINYKPPDFRFIEQNQMNETEKKQWESIAQFSNFKSGSYLMMNLQIFDIEGSVFKFSIKNLTQNMYPSSIIEEIKNIYFKIEDNNQTNININGQNIVTYEQFVEGQSLFSFSQVTISSIPTQQKYLQISYSISLQDNPDIKPILLLLNFRACKVGEVLKQADSNSYNCEQCQLGYYSLEDPTSDQLWNQVTLQEKIVNNTAQIQCIKCPDTANSCQSNEIQIKDGYWRANNKTSEIIQCNQNTDSCKPNDPQSLNGCTEGYIGPICSVCDVTGKYWIDNRYTNSFIDTVSYLQNQSNDFSANHLQNNQYFNKKQGFQNKIQSIKSVNLQDSPSVENYSQFRINQKNNIDSNKQENYPKQISRNHSLFYQEEQVKNKSIIQNEEDQNIDIFEELSQLQQRKQIHENTYQQQIIKYFIIYKGKNISSLRSQQNDNLEFGQNNVYQDDSNHRMFKSPTRENQLYYDGNHEDQYDQNYKFTSGKQSIKKNLKIIFTYYCSYGDRTNTTILKSNKFRRLMIESQIIDDDKITQKYIDLLYTQYTQNKTPMDFNNFCNILAKISSEKYKQMLPAQALINVIDKHFWGLFKHIMNDTELGKDLKQFENPIHESVKTSAKHLFFIFKRIYLAYFSWEPTNSFKLADNFKQSMNGLFNFLKDFDIFPNLMTKSTSFLLYDQLVETSSNQILSNNVGINTTVVNPFGYDDIGKLFTLNKFITFIIKTSEIAFSKIPEAQQFQMEHPIQKFIALLERMELSEGFQNFEKKIHSTHNSTTSLILPPEAIKEILDQYRELGNIQLGYQHSIHTPQKEMTIKFNESVEKLNKISPVSQFDDQYTMSKSPISKQNRKLQLLMSLGIDDRALEVFETYQSELQYTFISFCQYGEPCNTQYLKTIKLTKLLKSAGLMKKREPINYEQESQQISPQRYSIRDKDEKYVDQTFIDCLIAKLIGPNQVRQFTNKMSEFDRQITSPNIGFLSYSSNKTDNNGSKGKLEYEHFLKIIQEISFQLYPDQDIYDSVNKVIQDNILKAQVDEDRSNNRKVSENYLALHNAIIEDRQITDLMVGIHPNLSSYFKRYAFPKETKMNLDQFLQFCKDFDVYPNLMPKSQLHYIFTALSFIYKQQNGQSESKQHSIYQKGEDDSTDYINPQLFTEAMVHCAIEIYTIEKEYVNRILLLLERMNSSNGPKIMLKSLGLTSAKTTQWDLLAHVRKRYQYFYDQKMMTRNQHQTRLYQDQDLNNFDQLLDLGVKEQNKEYVNF